jgi:UTP--glucose-1-phosphate uridylyltransferase
MTQNDTPDPSLVRRALVPCGGRGTRMLGFTRGAPKELIPVAGIPAVEWVARECGASGIEEMLVVIAPGKEAIAVHLSSLAGGPGVPEHIRFVVQPEPRGLADAIRLGREFAGAGPLAVALPDNLFPGNVPALAQVIETFVESGRSTVAVAEILAAEAARRGATAVLEGQLVGDAYHITRIPDKGDATARFDTGGRRSAFTNVGRYCFTAEVFEAIDAVERDLPSGAELDDVPVLQRLLAKRRLAGRCLRARFLDLGLPEGLAEADRLLRAQP